MLDMRFAQPRAVRKRNQWPGLQELDVREDEGTEDARDETRARTSVGEDGMGFSIELVEKVEEPAGARDLPSRPTRWFFPVQQIRSRLGFWHLWVCHGMPNL